MISLLLSEFLGVKLLGYLVSLHLTARGTASVHRWLPYFAFQLEVHESSCFLFHPPQPLVFSVLFIMAMLVSVWWYLIIQFDLHFPYVD